jgi:peptidoglycan/LPS O-acetylase OafA/YrhL
MAIHDPGIGPRQTSGAAVSGQVRPTALPAQTGGRIGGLDGLRAFSILFVFIGHLSGTRNFRLPGPVASALAKVPLAEMGVQIFFVISGFLITTLLVEEERRTGTVSLIRFYFRRTLRIFPPFYVFLATVMLLRLGGYIELRPGDFLHAVTYTTNYHHDRAWYLGHTWSLSVEEQFYLLWPFLYRALRQRRLKVLVAYVLVAPVWRLAYSYLAPDQRLTIGETFFTTADSIAVGCVLALARPKLLAHPLYRRIMDSPAYLLLLPALLLFGVLHRYAKLDWLVCMSARNVLIALFIERVTRTSTGLLSGILNNRAVVLVGVWSYSLYLWQQLFINRKVQDSPLTAFPVNLLLAFTLAAVSYYVIERPALRLRQRLETRFLPRRSALVPGAARNG